LGDGSFRIGEQKPARATTAAVHDPKRSASRWGHLQYYWDGQRISRYFDYAEERWIDLAAERAERDPGPAI
jgi:hypothetical protein